jgi:hypothetical protein
MNRCALKHSARELAVGRFDKGVVGRFARPGEVERDAALVRPLFWPVIEYARHAAVEGGWQALRSQIELLALVCRRKVQFRMFFPLERTNTDKLDLKGISLAH